MWKSKKFKKSDILVGGNSKNKGRNVGRNKRDTLRRKMGYVKGLSSYSVWEEISW